MKQKEKQLKELKRKARNYSVKDGIFSTIKDSISGNYIAPFAIAINSSNSLIAMLSSIPGLLGPISEWFSSRLIEKHSRKNIVLTFVFFEILTWIPLIAISLLYYYGIITSILPLMLLLFFSLYVITSYAGNPAWFSWIGDIIDEEHRGRWFAKRRFIFSIATIAITILSALILDFFKKNNLIMMGFIAIFLIAMISRIISRAYLKKQYEPKIKIEKDYYFSFWKFIKKAPSNNFGKFVIFVSLLNCVTMIASPLFTIYMLKELNFSYLTWIIVTMFAIFFTLISIKMWGRFADKYGNYEIFRITIILIALCPISWIFSKAPIYLILVPQLLSGIGWGGFNLAVSSYIFDCVTPQKRCLAVSYYELANGIGIFIGASISALLITFQITFMNIFLFLFLISGIGRLIVGLIMIPKIKEVRKAQKLNEIEAVKKFILGTLKIHQH